MIVSSKTSPVTLQFILLLSQLKTKVHTETTRQAFYTFAYSGNNAIRHYKASALEIPYHVLIAYLSLYCSGALIRSKVVVTAASCLCKWQRHRIVVKVGSDTVTGMGQVIEVVDVKKHEYFGHSSKLDNDIAILMLEEHVKFGNGVQKIILLQSASSLPFGATVDVSGYADQQQVKYSNSLLWSEMVVLHYAECMKTHPRLITRSNFCVKYNPERRLNDNGGPAVFKEQLVGILSYGAANKVEPFVAVMTNISYFYRWITLNAKRFMTKYCVEPITFLKDIQNDDDDDY